MSKYCPLCFECYPDTQDTCTSDGAFLCNQPEPLEQNLVNGRYQVIKKIGAGGMGTVYKVSEMTTGEPAAMKVLSGKRAQNPMYRARFLRESNVGKQLIHPNIVEVFEVDETPEGLMYIVMELLSGEDLADTLGRGPLPIQRALSIIIQIARGLAFAHDAGVIHRDVKPGNVMFAGDSASPEPDHVKLVDFGLAWSKDAVQLTASGEVFGTPEYVSPEQLTGDKATIHSDLYSLGILMYEIATGRLPFEGDIPSLFFSHVKRTPKQPSTVPDAPYLPAFFDEIVMKLLSKQPQDRYTDAHHLLVDLELLNEDFRDIDPALMSASLSSVDAVENRWNCLQNMIQSYTLTERPAWFDECMRKLEALVHEAKRLGQPDDGEPDPCRQNQQHSTKPTARIARVRDVLADDDAVLVREIEIGKKRLQAIEQGIESARLRRQPPAIALIASRDRLHRELRDKQAERDEIRAQLRQFQDLLEARDQGVDYDRKEDNVEETRDAAVLPDRELHHVISEFEPMAERVEQFLGLLENQ